MNTPLHIYKVQYVTKLLNVAEYVNAQEVPTDMKSITDRAAQTLLWTELLRGQLNILFLNEKEKKAILKLLCAASNV